MSTATPLLYLVATPIGNLEDFSFRGLRILKEVKGIICEDPYQTRKLLNAYAISTPCTKFQQHSPEEHLNRLLQRIEQDGPFAYVTDAGTPGISDPGERLVCKARTRGVKVCPIPGPSSVTTLLSVAGFGVDKFLFAGFAPNKNGRERFFSQLNNVDVPIVLLESKYRLLKTLTALTTHLGEERRVVIGRELTKLHEEILSLTLKEAVEHFQTHPRRGEFILVIDRPLRSHR